MLTDTHCHLDSQAFDADRLGVLTRAREAGVTRILAPGLGLKSSQDCVRLASEDRSVFAAIGVHPTDDDLMQPDFIGPLRMLAADPRVVAIGEIGLDYYWVHDISQQAHQREALQAQLALAADLGKPVVLHCREKGDAESGPCFEDLLAILEQWCRQSVSGRVDRGVLHSFSGNLDAARRAVDLGFLIGVTGPVTFKNAASRRDLISALPLNRLLIETDAPYLSPEPHRGRRNEPAFVAHIADKIAAIQSRTTQEVAAVTAENAASLFSWGETA